MARGEQLGLVSTGSWTGPDERPETDPDTTPCPECHGVAVIVTKRRHWTGWQCTRSGCRRDWNVCAQCGAFTRDLVPPAICPGCGRDRRPVYVPPLDLGPASLRNPLGMAMEAEVAAAAADREGGSRPQPAEITDAPLTGPDTTDRICPCDHPTISTRRAA